MQMNELKKFIINCKKCELYKTKINYVVGDGSETAKIVFIGEAPGANEDKTGTPFVGKAGKILDELLNSIEIPRESIYICNVLKCRPPQNREPLPKEITACTPFLLKQLEILNPKIIVTLGNYSTKFIMERYNLKDKAEGISKVHGKVFKIKDLCGNVKLKLIPLYHPAGATYNPEMKTVMLEDIKIIKSEFDGN